MNKVMLYPPSLEPITIDTFEAVFPNTTKARLAVKSGKTQYKDLGRPSSIKNSMQYVTPILYSQNSSNNYTNIIPLSGSGYISRYDNDDGAGQVFGRFTAMGECSVNTSTPAQTVDYYLNPNNVDIVQGSVNVYTDNGEPDAYYNSNDWVPAPHVDGIDLPNQQIISLNTSIVTTFVSETNRVRDELQFELTMYSGWNGTNGSDPQGFNLEDIECKVYTQAGQVQNIGSVLQYGWFNISNIAGYNTIITETSDTLFNGMNRWIKSRVPITSSGIVCTADWEMFDTLFDLGLMRERNPKNGSGVVALEWIIKANSGKYEIKSGDKINWRIKGFFRDSRGGGLCSRDVLPKYRYGL